MEYRKLREMATISISNVDKKTAENEKEVKLCNFVDVYRNWAITKNMTPNFMVASAKESEIEKYALRKGDVCITKDSETKDDIGMSTYIADDIDNLVLGYHCALISPDRSVLDGKYLNAFLQTDFVRKFYELNASGSGQRYTLSLDAIGDIPIPVISLEEQKKKGELLSLIDRKIENNNKINDNLSHMVQDVFVQMFADKTIHANSCILDVASKISDGEHGTVQNTAGTPYYLLSCKNIKNGHLTIGSDERTISEDTFKKLRNRTKLSKGDVLITSVGSVGEAYLLNSEPSHIEFQRSVAMIKPNKKVVTSSYLFASLVFQQPRLVNAAHGAVQQCLFLSDIEQLPIYIPTKDEVDSFDSYVTPLLNTITENDDENISLSLLREWLLPMLMSGQATIAD